MKKFLLSMTAALLLIMTGASMNANAGNMIPSPKSPVDEFITLFTRLLVFIDARNELSLSTDSSKKQVLQDLEDEISTKMGSFFDSNGKYVLSASEKNKLANYFDILICSVNNEKIKDIIAGIKSQIPSIKTLNDLNNTVDDNGVPMCSYYYGDIVMKYPEHYNLNDSDTRYGVHLYLQHKTSNPTSVYMEIEEINTITFGELSTSELKSFLISECQNYYNRYIDEDYKINWKTDITFYEDSDMAVMALSGYQYGEAFTGEFVCLLHGKYEITAFITGSDDTHEEEARKIFLSTLQ